MDRDYLEGLLLNSLKKNTPEEVKRDELFSYKDKGAYTFTLTRDLVERLELRKWFSAYEKEAKVSTAGIRGPQNVVYPHDTRFPINTVGVALATLAKALVLKEKYKGKKLVKLCASEVRYNSKIYLDIISKIQAQQGITTLIPEDIQTIPIWLASFLIFKLDLVGGEYITSSHGISVKNATKDLNNQGSQFLPNESMEFVAKIKEILDTVEKDGKYTIEFASSDNSLINQDVMKRLNNGIDLYVEYLRVGVANDKNLEVLKKFNKKIVIDNVGGCAYQTTSKILEKLGVSDKFVWLNTEQDPFFHAIGKCEKQSQTGDKILYDWSLDVTVSAKDENGKEYYPVINSLGYDEKLKEYPLKTAVLITDPDHDRLNIVQVDDIKNTDMIKKTGVDFVKLDKNRILTIYSANQAFLMIMDFWAKQLKKSGKFNDFTRFIIKTSASSKSWDEWALNNNVKVVNTPVGFKEIANVSKKVEAQILNGIKEIQVEDIFGNTVSLGSNARILFAGEESGGMIIGSEDMITSKCGRKALAMREKSASEAIIVASSMLASLGEKSLWENLSDVYRENNIIAKYDARQDISYYNESETDIEKLKIAKLEGEKKRTKNDLFYLALAIALKEDKITLEQVKEILSSTFEDLDFTNLLEVKFAGDGTYLNFADKFVEIRPSGTDAKTKAYAGGSNKEDLILWASRMGNYDGSLNKVYLKYLDEEYINSVKGKSLKLYDVYALKGASEDNFTICNYDFI